MPFIPTPEEVRRLRGARSRAAFARELGVTAHTVYRWELANGSPHARRPAGALLERLRQLADRVTAHDGPVDSYGQTYGGGGLATRKNTDAIGQTIVDGGLTGDRTQKAADASGSGAAAAAMDRERSEPTPADLDADPDALRALGALERALEGDWRTAESVAMAVLAAEAGTTRAARALAGAGLALVEALSRADARRAVAALAATRTELAALPAPAAAYAEAAFALAHSLPSGQFFDVGRIHSHVARAEALARPGDGAIAGLLCIAQVNAAMVVGDEEQLLRAFARIDEAVAGAGPAMIDLHVAQLRSLEATLLGRPGAASEALERQLADPRVATCAPLEARACAMLALRRLDEPGGPAAALELARRSRAVADAARLDLGVHTALALRAEAEALLRLGRLDELAAVFAETDRILAERGMAVTPVLLPQARYLMLAGKAAALDDLAARLSACTNPSLRAACAVHAACIEALASLTRRDPADVVLPRFARAEELAARWSLLARDLLLARVNAALVYGAIDDARTSLRRAQRIADRLPSAWATAHLRRLEGTLLATTGRWREGRSLLEAAAATASRAGDRLDVIFAECTLAAFETAAGEPGAADRAARARAALAELGLDVPGFLRCGVVRDAGEGARATPGPSRAEPILVAVERLAAPGTPPPAILRELAAVIADIVPGRTVVIDEVDDDGSTRRITGQTAADGPAGPTASPAKPSSAEGARPGNSLPGTSPEGSKGVRGEAAADPSQHAVEPHRTHRAAGAAGQAADAGGQSLEWFEFGDGLGRRLLLGVAQPLADADRAAIRVIALAAALALEVASLRGLAHPRPSVAEELPELPGVIAVSPAMRRLRVDLARLAGSRATVVLTGESGSGKEVIARAVHDLSPRSREPYVAFNCAAVPHDLFEGQLFGFRKGAFTGATTDHPGVVRAAGGGTLFLDEIGELPLDVQPKLLRFLENGEVFPIGAQRPVVVDVRVIAATHRDLAALVRQSRFREDLYYRLQVVPLRIPPLRERRDDIPALARHFVRLRAPTGVTPVFAPDALAALTAHTWPGNVRELRNVIERLLAFAPIPEVITRAHLDL